jgi:hypothetical protein
VEAITIIEVTKEAIVGVIGVIIEVVEETIAIIEVTKEAIVGVIIEVVEEIIAIIEMTTDVITGVINGIIFNQNEDIFIKNNSAVKTN